MNTPHILIIESDPSLNDHLTGVLGKMNYLASGVDSLAAAEHYLSKKEPHLALLEGNLPDGKGLNFLPRLTEICPVIFLTASGSVRQAVEAIKAGAVEYLVKPINVDELEVMVKRTLENAVIRQNYELCREQLDHGWREKQMIGKSPKFKKAHELIRAVAPTDVTVLIQGESGVGKELVAAEIHRYSARREKNFVAIDCCTLQEKLFESELFGHERGAFTGADRQKKGLIEGAESGTLFLDEIGEIEPSIQAKLLRVLETGQFRRLGGTKDLAADVRIVAATNRNLEQMSREGTFRSDLYYRLSAFMVHVPPLRERREDIPNLVENFIQNNHHIPKRLKKIPTISAMKRLIAYDWPGNIRELKNVVERALILSGSNREIRCEHLAFGSKDAEMPLGIQFSFNHEPTLEEIERYYLETLLKKYSGNRAKVAAAMGISERNTYRLLKKYGYHAENAAHVQ